MLSETHLNSVSGGFLDFLNIFKVLKLDQVFRASTCEVIDLKGIFGSIGFHIGQWTGSLGYGHYNASDSSGQHGHMDQVRGALSPAFFGTNHLAAREQSIRVINSNDMRDLGGARLVLGAVARFPQAIQRAMGDMFGAKHDEIIGIAIPKTAVGAQVSIPAISLTGKDMTSGVLLSVSKENAQNVQITGQGMNLGIEMFGAVELNAVKVDDRDGVPAPNFAIHQQLRPDGTFKYPWEI